MIEIIILAKLCRRIGNAAREKGHRAIGYQLLLILFWVGGEFGIALFAGVMLALLYGKSAEEYLLFVYIAAFAGAAIGAWMAFRIVASLPAGRVDEVEQDEGTDWKPIPLKSDAITELKPARFPSDAITDRPNDSAAITNRPNK